MNGELLNRMTTVQAAGVAGLLAVLCYVGAVGNDWALDDEYIIETNPAVHSMSEARAAFFEPYWPESSGIPAGQYRPLSILWYSFDWFLSNGDPAWFHLVNACLHAIATVILVFVLARWLPPVGAAMAGVVFAVHPVHVEAVANVVGRGEVATAALLLGGLLTARRFRLNDGRRRQWWLVATLAVLACALFMKEHAVVMIALVAADEYFDSSRATHVRNLNLYIAMAAVTVAWLFLWRGVAGDFVTFSETAALRNMSLSDRLATVFPVFLDVTRLLVWPFDLAADYNPQMIQTRSSWSIVSIVGLLHVLAVVGLAWGLRRKAPVIAAAIVCSIIVYLPTSNLVFATGVLLAERNLYLPIWAPAAVVGWLSSRAMRTDWKRVVTVATVVMTASFAVRTIERVPEWQDTEQILIGAYAEHPENYRSHLRLSTLFITGGDSIRALAQALVGGAIFPDDPFGTERAVPLAMGLGYPQTAVREAVRGLELGSGFPSIMSTASLTLLETGHGDSALAVARLGREMHPSSPMAAETYVAVAQRLGAPEWVRLFAVAHQHWVWGELIAATDRLRDGIEALELGLSSPWGCWDLASALPLIDALAVDLVNIPSDVVASCARLLG